MNNPAVVIVTGAAGAIGCATAVAFLRAGFSVLGLDRHTPESARSAGILAGAHASDEFDAGLYKHAVVDVTDARAVTDVVNQRQDMGHLVHLISVAGGAVAGETTLTDPADVEETLFRSSIELNLVSQFTVVRACLPWLRSTPSDTKRSIALMSSINGLLGMDMFGYSAAKAGVNGLARVLAACLGPEGIRVNAVAPGTVRTPRTEMAWRHDDDHFPRLTRRAALNRLTTPEEVANTLLTLATALTSVTGQVLSVDSGQAVAWRY